MAPQISRNTREQIIVLHQNGYRVSDIEKTLGVARKTIYLWLRRHEELGSVTAFRRQNYERTTTYEQDMAIVAAHQANPYLPTKTTSTRHNVSSETIRRRLKEAGLKMRGAKHRKVCAQLGGGQSRPLRSVSPPLAPAITSDVDEISEGIKTVICKVADYFKKRKADKESSEYKSNANIARIVAVATGYCENTVRNVSRFFLTYIIIEGPICMFM